MLEVEAVEGAAKELVQLEDERYAHKRIFPYHFLLYSLQCRLGNITELHTDGQTIENNRVTHGRTDYWVTCFIK